MTSKAKNLMNLSQIYNFITGDHTCNYTCNCAREQTADYSKSNATTTQSPTELIDKYLDYGYILVIR